MQLSMKLNTQYIQINIQHIYVNSHPWTQEMFNITNLIKYLVHQ